MQQTMCPSIYFEKAKWMGLCVERFALLLWLGISLPVFHCCCCRIHQKQNETNRNKWCSVNPTDYRIDIYGARRAYSFHYITLHSLFYLDEWNSMNSILLLCGREKKTGKLLRYIQFSRLATLACFLTYTRHQKQ